MGFSFTISPPEYITNLLIYIPVVCHVISDVVRFVDNLRQLCVVRTFILKFL